jgi:hypothetical protein
LHHGSTNAPQLPILPNRVVQPVCTNAHVMRPGAPSLAVDGSEEIGLFVAAMDSLYIRLPYNRQIVLVKNPFARALSGWPNAFSP